jgi:DNA-binding protein HU-beta
VSAPKRLCQMWCTSRGAPQQGPCRQTRRRCGDGKRRPFPYKQGARNPYRAAAGLHTRRRQKGRIVNKTELIERIAQEAGVPPGEAQKHFGAFESVVTEALKGGEEVQITGFGKFSVRERKAREGRNPQTGEKMKIAASKVPSFSAGNALKQAI